MPFDITPLKDVAAPPNWRSSEQLVTMDALGDDASFLLRFGKHDQKFLLVELSGLDVPLDPKIYVLKGRRYKERNAIALTENLHFALVIAPPINGSSDSIRLDPCSFIGKFSMSCAEYDTISQLEKRLTVLRNTHPELHVEYFRREGGNIAMRRIRDWLSKFSRQNLRQHSKALYTLAGKELGTVQADPSKNYWLSIVVPTFNTPSRYLNDVLGSFTSQGIEGAELIISDDASTLPETRKWLRDTGERNIAGVRIIHSNRNGGISAATNSGIEVAFGTWIALLDHDDLIAPYALKSLYKTIESNSDAQFIYTDTLVVKDDLSPRHYILKPAYDPVMLTGVNYINHFSIFRRERLLKVGRLRSDRDGSQDYDILLRYLCDLQDNEVVHLPFPAYWWRRHSGSFSKRHMHLATLHARQALSDAFAMRNISVQMTEAGDTLFHRAMFSTPNITPKVSIIIPSRNGFNLIKNILSDLYHRTNYPIFEVIIIDNGTTDERVLSLYREYQARYSNFRYRISPEEFNFAKAINVGFSMADGDLFLLLNNDIEVIDGGWLNEMVSCFQYEKVGIVGAKLLYSDDRIQHAGVIVGFGGLAGHWYNHKHKDFGGPFGRLHVRSSMTCVTGAAMLISRECFEHVGAWDEENFAVAYNDVDYCIRAYKLKYRIVWTPFACLYHHESVSRGSDRSAENRLRFEREKLALRKKHGTGTFADPATNPLLTVNSSVPQLRITTALPPPRTWFTTDANDFDPT